MCEKVVAVVLVVELSPKSQNRLVMVPVELSVKLTVSGSTPLVGLPLKLASGIATPVPVSALVLLPALLLLTTTTLLKVVVVSSSNAGSSTNALTGTGVAMPLASFSGSPTSGVEPLTVNFTDNSTGTITSRFWDFGDSSTTNTTATTFSHIYLAAGTNTVSLTASGPLDTNTLQRTG